MEERVQELSQDLTYTRPNGDDIVGDTNLIENVRDEQSRDIIDNCRIGSYDGRGNYVVDAEIVKELIGMKKRLTRTEYENTLRDNREEYEFKAFGKLPLYGKTEFRLVISNSHAKLYLIEEVYREGGGYLEVYGEKLADYVSDSNEKNDLKSILTAFNITIIDEDDDDEGKTWEPEDGENVKKLLIRKIYLSLLAKQLEESTSEGEKHSFDRMVELLKSNGGEYGKKVLKHFLDRLERRPEVMTIKDKHGYNKALNDMLMGSIEVATTVEDLKNPETKALFEQLNQIRNEGTEQNIIRAQQAVTAGQVLSVLEKISKDNKITLEEVKRGVQETEKSLKKPVLQEQGPKPILKQETRDAILKQAPKNAVVQEAPQQVPAAALKQEAEQAPKPALKQKPAASSSSKPGPAKKKSAAKGASGAKKGDNKPAKTASKLIDDSPARPRFSATNSAPSPFLKTRTQGAGGITPAPVIIPGATGEGKALGEKGEGEGKGQVSNKPKAQDIAATPVIPVVSTEEGDNKEPDKKDDPNADKRQDKNQDESKHDSAATELEDGFLGDGSAVDYENDDTINLNDVMIEVFDDEEELDAENIPGNSKSDSEVVVINGEPVIHNNTKKEVEVEYSPS